RGKGKPSRIRDGSFSGVGWVLSGLLIELLLQRVFFRAERDRADDRSADAVESENDLPPTTRKEAH
ncbi:hypothetical protein O6468_24320, partial [Salmonella enterica subsp. enterica]